MTAIEKGSFINSMENDRSSNTILGLNNDHVDDKMSVNNTSATESVEHALQTAEHVGVVVGDGVDNSKEGNETTFKRYDGVAIVTKVLSQEELQKLQQWACLIGHAYNDRMNYDIIVFTTIPWDDDSIRQLQKVVAPGKLSVVNEGPATLDGFLADMTKDEIQFLRERCGIGNNATKTLTWNHHCHDYGTRHVSNLVCVIFLPCTTTTYKQIQTKRNLILSLTTPSFYRTKGYQSCVLMASRISSVSHLEASSSQRLQVYDVAGYRR